LCLREKKRKDKEKKRLKAIRDANKAASSRAKSSTAESSTRNTSAPNTENSTKINTIPYYPSIEAEKRIPKLPPIGENSQYGQLRAAGIETPRIPDLE